MSPTNAARPDTFPRQYARTRRFSLGEPRGFRIIEPGVCGDDLVRVLFLRSQGGSDPVGCLWVAEVDPAGRRRTEERLVVDPSHLGAEERDLPPEEKARRERMRETASGITAFATDRSGTVISFALAGSLVTHELISAQTILHATAAGVVDPRVDPTGLRVAYLSGPTLRLLDLADGTDRLLCHDDAPTVSWGAADFIAGEEHHRFRGYWWSPDGERILAQRTDDGAVQVWWVADPAHPDRAPVEHRYPAAGTPNATVSLHIVDAVGSDAGRVTDVAWDNVAYPYLTVAGWNDNGAVMTVQSRSQQRERTLMIDTVTGSTTVAADCFDERWIDIVPGTPALLSGGQIICALDTHVAPSPLPGAPDHDTSGSWPDPDGTRTLALHRRGGTSVSTLGPANLQIDRVLHADDHRVVAVAHGTRPLDGIDVESDTAANGIVVLPVKPSGAAVTVVAGGAADPGIHDATVSWPTGAEHPTLVVRSASIARRRAEITVHCGGRVVGQITNMAEAALVDPAPVFMRVGPRAVPTAVLLPADHDPLVRLPVLVDPYGGPHGTRVVRSRNAHATSQWFADQGFAVVVADNRGVPGPGPEYEKSVHLDLATHAVEDQVEALLGAAAAHPQLDLERVAIRGWSFGGYLAALCVMRRPDVFHAAVVGAPVTDWRLYDTAYTERYLGHPDEHPDAYEQSSVLRSAADLRRPMMIVHGLADDNVVVAHSLRLSSALLAAGRPHEVLPLSGVTHMTPQEDVAENLLLLQLAFLRRSLGIDGR